MSKIMKALWQKWVFTRDLNGKSEASCGSAGEWNSVPQTGVAQVNIQIWLWDIRTNGVLRLAEQKGWGMQERKVG